MHHAKSNDPTPMVHTPAPGTVPPQPMCRHQFVLRMLSGPTTCAYCSSTIWVWQGLRYRHCRLCKVNFHDQCFQEVLRNLSMASHRGDSNTESSSGKGNGAPGAEHRSSAVEEEGTAHLIHLKDDDDDAVVVVSTTKATCPTTNNLEPTQQPAARPPQDDSAIGADEVDEEEQDDATIGGNASRRGCPVSSAAASSSLTCGRFFMVNHQDVPSIPTTASYFVHHHELAPTRFILPKWECIQCANLLAVGEEGLHCLSCDGCNLHRTCVDAFLTSEGGSGARCLSAKDIAMRSHDVNKSAIVSETMSLMHLFRRRNVKWSSLLTASNPFTLIPTIIARHTALYDDCCRSLAGARCNNSDHPSHHHHHDDTSRHSSVGTSSSSTPRGPQPPPAAATATDAAQIYEFQDALRYATAVYGLAYQRDAMTSCLGGVAMHVFRQQALLTPKDEVNNVAVTEILALPRESLKFSRWSYKTLEPSYCVLVDHAVESIVLAFRGSLSDADFLSDACGFVREFCDGHAHQGMADMVDALFDQESRATGLIACLTELLERHSGYRLLITGHSLGGGLAQLFGVRLAHERPKWLGACCWDRRATTATTTTSAANGCPYSASSSAAATSDGAEASPPASPIRMLVVVAFAPPPVFTMPCADLYDDFVSCIVGGNDVVCRMQLNSIDRLANDFGGGGPTASSSSPSKPKLSAELYQELTEELHLVGRVYLLTHPTSKRRNRMLRVPRGHFVLHHIFVMPDAFSNHLMDHYGKGLRSAAAAVTTTAAGVAAHDDDDDHACAPVAEST